MFELDDEGAVEFVCPGVPYPGFQFGTAVCLWQYIILKKRHLNILKKSLKLFKH